MSEMKKTEVSVLSGEEGRFLEWTDGSKRWTPHNYYNYRHSFEESTLVASDYTALRKQFGVEDVGIPDKELVLLSPESLQACARKSA